MIESTIIQPIRISLPSPLRPPLTRKYDPHWRWSLGIDLAKRKRNTNRLHLKAAEQVTVIFVEGLIVADVPQDEICRQYTISQRMLEVYEDVFFDVRDLLPHRNFIFCNIMAPLLMSGLANDPDLVWKLFAYTGGMDALLSLVDISREISPRLQELLKRILANRQMRNAVMGAMTVAPTRWNGTSPV